MECTTDYVSAGTQDTVGSTESQALWSPLEHKRTVTCAQRGVNVIPFLEVIGLPDSVVDILKNSQSGNALTAYAMFKIATPARYTVTLGGTSFTVKYLRSHGYMSTPPPVKEYLQGRMEETKELITEKMEETKDRLTEKLQETKEKVSFKKKVE